MKVTIVLEPTNLSQVVEMPELPIPGDLIYNVGGHPCVRVRRRVWVHSQHNLSGFEATVYVA